VVVKKYPKFQHQAKISKSFVYFRSMKQSTVLVLLVFITSFMGLAQDTIMPLWPDKIPYRIETSEKEVHEFTDILKISKVQKPTIEVYLPSKANATGHGVLIFPGGGYHILAYDWEGTDIAKMLNAKGITGIVVKYRLPTSKSMEQNHLVPLVDAQRALKLVKSKAKEFYLDPDKIGIMGFSAGGHLAASLSTHAKEKLIEAKDEIDNIQAKPDFTILMYPVIQFGETATHQGSQEALLGKNPKQEWLNYFSIEKQVTQNTSPTILFHSSDDTGVPIENSLSLYKTLHQKGVSASLHIFPTGGHGFGLAPETPMVKEWPKLLVDWIMNLTKKGK